MNIDVFTEQHFENHEIQENLEWYNERVSKSLEIFNSPAMYKTRRNELLDYTNGLKVEAFEKLILRTGKKGSNLSFQFKDGHRGYVLETGGVAFLHPQDEAVLPHMRHCYIISANMRYQNEELVAIMHHGPAWKQLPFFIDALTQHGEVSSITCAGNDTFHKGVESTDAVSQAMSGAFGQQVKGIDLSLEQRVVHVHIENKHLKLLVANPTGVVSEKYQEIPLKITPLEEPLA